MVVTGPPSNPSDGGLSLSAGDRLGPYEIVKPLGVGGMGEVYRARDTRLRRDVAVKVLHRSLSITPEHVSRLAREARAAGSLNHPNIVSVFDVGTEGSVPYVVSELLEGESLRTRLARGPLPYRKALDYGIQIAQALGAAHEKGIWHRDVKPGNIFVTTDGRAKLLDFGLVKLERERIGSQDSTADATKPGGVHGTVGYMSPEQTLGEGVDHRSDLFALGAVLYEMLTGVPAFRRSSAIETTKAVLNEEPADRLERDSPPAAAAVVRRCLEKSSEERFQSARDLAFHLQQLQEPARAGTSGPVPVASRRRWLVLALAGLALAGGAAALAVRALRPAVPAFEQLTFHRSRIGGARFASEEGGVVYSEAREGRPLEVWRSEPGSPESRNLGYGGADVLSVRGGKLALSLERRFTFGERFMGTLAEVRLGGGTPLPLAENVEDADWDPDGAKLAIARSVGIQADSLLEYPPGHALYKTSGSIRYPRFSRDGRRIAFVEDPSGRGAGGKVATVDLEGHLTSLTESWASVRGLAWSPDGNEVWFAAGGARTNRALRAVNLEGRQRLILEAPASLTLWDIGSDGRILLARDDERSSLVGVPPGETVERDLSWFDTSGLADLSEDGTKVLFDDRFGVYVRDTKGSPPVDLGLKGGQGDDFSPDGEKVLATTDSGRRLLVVSLKGGERTPLPAHGIDTYRGALWLPDGRHVLVNGTMPKVELRSYVQDLQGGPPRPLTPPNTWALSISQDGIWAAAIGPGQGISLWPVAGGKERLVPSSRPDDRPVAWSADGRSLWVFRRGAAPAEVSQVDIDSGQRREWKKLQPRDPTGVYSINQFRVASDGRSYFYSYKRVLSQLYTVSGLK